MAIDTWFHTWLKEYKKNTIKYVTYKLCQDEYESYIKAVFGKRKLKDIRGEHVQKLFYSHVLPDKKAEEMDKLAALF
ncbi:MAG: hypothetical protein ACLTED_09910 [Blautia wexlerae]|uniref:hypothetical protein n=1 Tax=Blautia TaxID=572511 RepID=UPI0009E9FCAC|nr:hypothetical protein [Blautia wexlerae]NSG01491.1 hypothetical protein [Blautia wexlerae]